MTLIPFMILSVIAVVFALLLVVSRNAVHGALFLVMNFAAIAVCFLILSAEFIAIVQIAVYAGAIMVLFLFVIMLLNIHGSEERMSDNPISQILIAAVLGVLLLMEVAWLAPRAAGLLAQAPASVTENFGSAEKVGMVLFTDYILAFEFTAFILLVAMMGAVVLAKRRLS